MAVFCVLCVCSDRKHKRKGKGSAGAGKPKGKRVTLAALDDDDGDNEQKEGALVLHAGAGNGTPTFSLAGGGRRGVGKPAGKSSNMGKKARFAAAKAERLDGNGAASGIDNPHWCRV